MVHKRNKENIENLKELVKELKHEDISEPKNIVVHGELYKRLLMEKGNLLIRGKTPATFENAIINNINREQHLAVLVNRLIRTHPEIKDDMVKLSKEISDDLHERINGMVASIKN